MVNCLAIIIYYILCIINNTCLVFIIYFPICIGFCQFHQCKTVFDPVEVMIQERLLSIGNLTL